MEEESGENWPSDSYLEEEEEEVGDVDVNVKDELYFDDEGFGSDDSLLSGLSESTDRKRELTERFHALSATIPGFKKTDETSILAKASSYVKQLEERVRELEQEVVVVVQSSSSSRSRSCEVNSNVNYCSVLPEVKVRVLEKDVLIIIHCYKHKGIMLKILSHLENLHLSVVNSSVLRFGKSTLDITIIAQMGEGYKMTVDELVKTLRVAILTH